MSSSLLLQQCPACLCLIWIVLEMGCGRPCSCYFVGCCFQDLFSSKHSIFLWIIKHCFSVCYDICKGLFIAMYCSVSSSFNGIFLLIQSLFIYVVVYPSDSGLQVMFLAGFSKVFVCNNGTDPTCKGVRDVFCVDLRRWLLKWNYCWVSLAFRLILWWFGHFDF